VIVPVFFLIFAVGLLVAYDFYLEPKINTETVLVANNDIEFKKVIERSDVVEMKIRKEHIVKGSFKPYESELVVGKNASINIKKGTQFYADLIDTYDLIPNEKEGEFIAPIPTDWLYAVPGSLRKTYIADFYAFPDSTLSIINELAKEADKNMEKKEKTTDKTKENVIDTNETLDQFVSENNKPILEGIRVSSVKDGANKEVKETTEDKDTATGVISEIEIIADEEILATMREYTAKGYKLFVVYKFERTEKEKEDESVPTIN
jgi:hypothetical protein